MMKHAFFLLTLIISVSIYAQKPCEFSEQIKDSLGEFHSTKEYLMLERKFGKDEMYLFFALASSDGTPLLHFQIVQKSNDFIKTQCFDTSSRIYLQLKNGKIVTLISAGEEICGTLIKDENNKSSRILNGTFLFLKNSFEDLRNSPVEIMRVKYTTETTDYIIKDTLDSELFSTQFHPSYFFMDFLHCVNEATGSPK